VLAEAARAERAERQNAAARDRPEGDHGDDVAAKVKALPHHFRALTAFTAG
jgi:hypothetical protein